MRSWLAAGFRIGATILTALLLFATSAPPDCDRWSPPVAFLADPGCGPGGLIIVEPDGDRSTIELVNPEALGVTPTGTYFERGTYDGTVCPFTLEKGEWGFRVVNCSDPADAGTGLDAGGQLDGGAAPCSGRSCTAVLRGADLMFECSYQGNPICASRLTVVK